MSDPAQGNAGKAGSLVADLPAYCTSPPIEVVVFGWGVTEDGQLGLDSKQDTERPSVIESLLGTSFGGFRFNKRPIVAGSRHTLALTDEGRVLSWGWNDRGTLGLGHRCARRASRPPQLSRSLPTHRALTYSQLAPSLPLSAARTAASAGTCAGMHWDVL